MPIQQVLLVAAFGTLFLACGPDGRCPAARDPDAVRVLAPATSLRVGTAAIGGRSYTHQWRRDPTIIYRLPEGHVWEIRVGILDCGPGYCPSAVVAFILVDEDGYRSFVSMDTSTGREWYRFVRERHKNCGAVFDELARSVLVK